MHNKFARRSRRSQSHARLPRAAANAAPTQTPAHELRRALASPASARPADVLALQRLAGNRAASRMMSGSARPALQREAAPPGRAGGPLAAGAEAAIQRERGGGQPIAEGVRGPLEGAFGANFKGVRVHTGAKADRLSRSVGAKAFTLGSDIFFNQGLYQPQAASGQRLLAHELAHVVQQGGGKANRVQAKLQVGPAGDRYEREADWAAEAATRAPANRAQRAVKPNAAPIARVQPMLAGRVQRQISEQALAAMNFANQQQPGYTNNALLPTDEIAFYQGANWLPAKITDKVIQIRTKRADRGQQVDDPQRNRLLLAQAYLLKVFVAEYAVSIMKARAQGKVNDLTDKQRKTMIPKALKRVEKEKKKLLALGLNKPGDVRPEIFALAGKEYSAERRTGKDDDEELHWVDVDRSVLSMGSTVDPTPRIEWRGTPVPARNLLRKVGLKVHSIILYNGPDGVQKYISSHANGDGLLEASQGLYTPDVEMLWMPTAQKRVLETGPQVVDKFPQLEAAAQQVTDRHSKYKLFKNNCNTAASFILQQAGVAAGRPGKLYFGWGRRLGDTAEGHEQEGDQQQQEQAGNPEDLTLDLGGGQGVPQGLPNIEGLQWME